MKPYGISWGQLTDDEFVEKLRRRITLFDRWRPWFICVSLAVLAATIWVFIKVISLLIGLVQPANAAFPMMGFALGTVAGLSFGFTIAKLLHGLIFAFGGFRAERLLLKHYVAIGSELSTLELSPALELQTLDDGERGRKW